MPLCVFCFAGAALWHGWDCWIVFSRASFLLLPSFSIVFGVRGVAVACMVGNDLSNGHSPQSCIPGTVLLVLYLDLVVDLRTMSFVGQVSLIKTIDPVQTVRKDRIPSKAVLQVPYFFVPPVRDIGTTVRSSTYYSQYSTN
jgi:hypothetical protein